MWRLFAVGGTLVHTIAGTCSLISTAAQSGTVNWLFASMETVGPGLLGLVATVLITLATQPPEVLAPVEVVAR